MRHWLVIVGAVVCLCAAGAPQGRDLAKEAQIEAALAKVDPSLVPGFREARLAMDRDDAATAIHLLEPVVQKAPAFDPAIRRLGNMKAQLGQREEGMALMRKALSLNRSMENYSTLAYNLGFLPKGAATPKGQQEALNLLMECRRLPAGRDPEILMMIAQLSLQLDRISTFKDAASDLQKLQPDLMQTHYFGAIAEALDEHWIRAEQEIRKAQQLGLPAEVARHFLDSGVETKASIWRGVRVLSVGFLAWAIGMGTLFLLGFILSRITVAHATRAVPQEGIHRSERVLRGVYRWVLNLAGLYYYLSLPVVFLLVITTTGAVIYGILATGYIPFKLLIILIIGAVMTVAAMVKSFFSRPKVEDPGRLLREDEAPELWELTREVAQAVNTRPVDEIRLTPGTDLAVYERGSWREKAGNRADRVLILGAAVLQGFELQGFKSVLAHEYGHFSHRDTAGGDIALRVQNDMFRFYLAMAHAGQATWMNVAFHFLRFYHFVFRRISHGATRLQEILADRVAAQTYGALAFEGGLRHVIRSGLTFEATANAEIREAIESRRPLQNLYDLPSPEPGSLEEAFEKALNRPTTLDDTHPSPVDRFRLVAPYRRAACLSTEGTARDLFLDPEALTQDMLRTFELRIAPHRKFDDRSNTYLRPPDMTIRE